MEVTTTKEEDILKNNKTEKVFHKSKKQLKENFISTIGFEKIPDAEQFVEGGFDRSDVIFLTELATYVLDVDRGGCNFGEFRGTVLHFFRNGANSCLSGDKSERTKTYGKLLKLINILNKLNKKEKLVFLRKLKTIKYLNSRGVLKYRKGSNRIELMSTEVNSMQRRKKTQ